MNRRTFLTATSIAGIGATLGIPNYAYGFSPNKTMKINKLITTEEHFIIPSINAKVMQYLTEKK